MSLLTLRIASSFVGVFSLRYLEPWLNPLHAGGLAILDFIPEVQDLLGPQFSQLSVSSWRLSFRNILLLGESPGVFSPPGSFG